MMSETQKNPDSINQSIEWHSIEGNPIQTEILSFHKLAESLFEKGNQSTDNKSVPIADAFNLEEISENLNRTKEGLIKRFFSISKKNRQTKQQVTANFNVVYSKHPRCIHILITSPVDEDITIQMELAYDGELHISKANLGALQRKGFYSSIMKAILSNKEVLVVESEIAEENIFGLINNNWAKNFESIPDSALRSGSPTVAVLKNFITEIMNGGATKKSYRVNSHIETLLGFAAEMDEPGAQQNIDELRELIRSLQTWVDADSESKDITKLLKRQITHLQQKLDALQRKNR